MSCQERAINHPSPILTRPLLRRSHWPSRADICIMALSLAILLMLCCHMSKLENVQGEFTCNKGQYLHHHYDARAVCLPCPEHTFISKDNHTFTDCGLCKVAHSHLQQVVLRSCTPYSDAVVGCPIGYFRGKNAHTANADGCQKCADCSDEDLHEARPCNETHDTVCCAVPGMVAAITMTGQRVCVFLQDKELAIVVEERRRQSPNNPLVSEKNTRPKRSTNSLSQILKRIAQIPIVAEKP